MAKQKASKQKKMNVRVDFTPMVDMMMLLITFFMLCTSLSKPQTMQLTMPTNDQNVQNQDKTATKASYTITIYLAADNQIYHVDGLPNYNDPSCLKKTTWGKNGIRKVLMEHTTEDGTNPVAQVMKAKEDLDKKKVANPAQYPDSVYQRMLDQIKSGIVNGQQIQTMTIIIKATDNSSYKNLVDALDEMQICSIGKYVIDKITPDDKKLLESAHVKM